MHKIQLNSMIFHANHGYFEEENKIGGQFEVNIELETDFSSSMNSDQLEGTIDYSKVYSIVKEEMNITSKLLEHLGKRIIDKLYHSFDEIQFIRLKISKLNPPMSGEIKDVSIIIEE